jgi:predicted protein tyrosine phosphatase
MILHFYEGEYEYNIIRHHIESESSCLECHVERLLDREIENWIIIFAMRLHNELKVIKVDFRILFKRMICLHCILLHI